MPHHTLPLSILPTEQLHSLVDRKASLQVQLLRQHHDRVYLQRDLSGETDAGEELFGVLLDPPEPYRDAAHLPVRVAKMYLSTAELKRFTRVLPSHARGDDDRADNLEQTDPADVESSIADPTAQPAPPTTTHSTVSTTNPES